MAMRRMLGRVSSMNVLAGNNILRYMYHTKVGDIGGNSLYQWNFTATGSGLELFQLPAREDNYIYFLKRYSSSQVTVVDPSDADIVIDCLRQMKWDVTDILNTHHHDDHVGGNSGIKEEFENVRIVGPARDHKRIAGVDHWVAEGDIVEVAGSKCRVINTVGHTLGHVSFYFEEGVLFCGDTLFRLGCGRLFEGSPKEMFQSLVKIKELPRDTVVCCGHEYTESNARFCKALDPTNPDLLKFIDTIRQQRSEDMPTVPFLLGDDLHLNPFLSATDATQFAEIRRQKDNF
eukprot:m.322302 g.322302  ORF g.322302 m.322302 type:complete len:289 (+) comp16531_c2_seq12:385-1251(+)